MRSAVAIVVLVLAACSSPSGHRLSVDLRTDMEPGHEFIIARVTLDAIPDGGAARQTESAAYLGLDFFDGRRVSDLDGLAGGEHRLRVELVDVGGHPVLARDVTVTLDADLAVTVVMTRDCRGVVCAPGSSCVAGRCGSPSCTVETPSSCTAECTTAADCVAMSSCSDAICDHGACLYRAVDARCATGERCDLDLGCVRDVGPCAAGTRLCGDVCAATCTFIFDAPTQSVWSVPRGCESATFFVWGAGGTGTGGAGGFATGTLSLHDGDPLVVLVGGHAPEPGAGGTGSTAGGGYSGVFRDTVNQAGALLIAGGGGGGGVNGLGASVGGAGGGPVGEANEYTAGAGTATSPGGNGGALFGGVGTGAPVVGAGGGGGYFGGGGGLGGTRPVYSGGGGGSGFVAPTIAGGVTLGGTGATPGGDADPHRAGAGAPSANGRVVIECF